MRQLRHTDPPHPSSLLHALAEIGHPGADSSARATERRKEKKKREMLLKRAQLVAARRGCLSVSPVCLTTCPYLSRLTLVQGRGGWTPTTSPLTVQVFRRRPFSVPECTASKQPAQQPQLPLSDEKKTTTRTQWDTAYYGNDRCVHLLTQRHMHTRAFLPPF